MNVLHVIPAYFPATPWGGPMFAVHGLNSALARLANVNIKVLTTDSAAPGVRSRLGLPSKTIAYSPSYEVLYCRRLLVDSVSPELLSRLPGLVSWADVVHLTYTYSFPTIPTIAACRLARKPLVWSPRGALQFSKEWKSTRRPRLKRVWEAVCDALLDPSHSVLHVTANSEMVASQSRIKRARAAVIPNGVDLPDLPGTRPRADGPLRLMFLGRIAPIKGLENLLDALVLTAGLAIRLDIYGQGDPAYTNLLERKIQDLRLDNRVFFHGHVDGTQKSEAFGNSDICVVPSHHENFCNVVSESLAHAVPVIVSKGAPWPRVEDCGCGLWVENDPASLAKAIGKMASSDLRQMGSRGRAWMASEYSWDARAIRMHSLYQLVSKDLDSLTDDVLMGANES